MKHLLVVVMAGLLGSCVSVTVQAPPAGKVVDPITTNPSTSTQSCLPYQPPPRKPLPEAPEITVHDIDDNERLAEKLANHAAALRTYIQDEHDDIDRAIRAHRLSCPETK